MLEERKMPIIGFSFTKINAWVDHKKKAQGEINVNSSPSLERIEKGEIETVGVKDVLVIGFRFDIKYDPAIGDITMEGDILYQTDKAKDVLAAWKKERKILDGAISVDIMNAIFRKCLTKAVDLTAELRLPPPLQFPVVKPPEE